MPIPLGFGGPFLGAGDKSPVSIAPGGGTSGPATSGSAPINVGGLFGSPANGNGGILSPQNIAVIGLAVIAVVVLLRR